MPHKLFNCERFYSTEIAGRDRKGRFREIHLYFIIIITIIVLIVVLIVVILFRPLALCAAVQKRDRAMRSAAVRLKKTEPECD